MEGRVVIRSDSFAFDGHCSVRSMKTHKQSRRSHLTSPSGRSSRTSSLHRPISAREKAMFVNLEFIKAIVTAEGVLLLNPLCQEVLLFVDQLRQQLPHKSMSKSQGGGQMDVQDNEMQLSSKFQGLERDLPFEFQVLEIALKVVCTYLDSSVADLERNAYPVLDELVRNVSTKNL
ncbi:magnesium transporter MRS2-4-like isoform X1 [Camellia sinensis]|uniref:magnesium transporter MRS2-4-like isoform X1 n=1 Tax=Camellia sinensis TaxID=4442 RepID=UPI00103653DF|nr:magnesium transporter MRS2-4-like isoform X1 [Camellia sinensis]